ncbi:MAG: hypothetical protein QW594_03590, partial [Candidatus Woesearchaeota archaeon]
QTTITPQAPIQLEFIAGRAAEVDVLFSYPTLGINNTRRFISGVYVRISIRKRDGTPFALQPGDHIVLRTDPTGSGYGPLRIEYDMLQGALRSLTPVFVHDGVNPRNAMILYGRAVSLQARGPTRNEQFDIRGIFFAPPGGNFIVECVLH